MKLQRKCYSFIGIYYAALIISGTIFLFINTGIRGGSVGCKTPQHKCDSFLSKNTWVSKIISEVVHWPFFITFAFPVLKKPEPKKLKADYQDADRNKQMVKDCLFFWRAY